ncbi:MAG: hypothetical protein S0880_02895 [Actinomycetota bacterium]|nr:hypothetical protein [Actinomycetota bacterium]
MAGIGLFGWGNGVLSAGVARLADQLDLPATIVGAHLLAFAVGLGTAGVLRPRLRADVDRPAPVVFATAMTLLALAPSASVSLAAALLMGLAGSPTLASAQARLGGGGDRGTRLLLWSNVLAALTAAASAALIAALAGGPVALVLVPPVVCGVALVALVEPMPHRPGTGAGTAGRQHRIDRPLVAALALISTIAAIESTLAAHLAPFLDDTGVPPGVALAAPFLLFGGQVVGRIVSTVRPPADPTRALLLTFAAVAAAFAPLLLLATPWRLVLVALVGAGIAAQYPLAIVVTLGLDPARAAMISSYSTAAVSIALVTSPSLVGALSDLATPRVGFAWIGVLLVAGATLAATSTHRSRAGAATTGRGEPALSAPA